jgi:hypothetical protein
MDGAPVWITLGRDNSALGSESGGVAGRRPSRLEQFSPDPLTSEPFTTTITRVGDKRLVQHARWPRSERGDRRRHARANQSRSEVGVGSEWLSATETRWLGPTGCAR